MRYRAFPTLSLLALSTLLPTAGHARESRLDRTTFLAASAAVHAVAVSGPILGVSPFSHDFGVADDGTSATFSFDVSNTGDENLHATVSTPDPAFTLTTTALDLAPGESATLPIAFEPTDGQHHGSFLVLQSNGGNVSLPLSGQGNAPPSIAQPADQTVAAFTSLTFTVTATDADDTLDDLLTFGMSSNLPSGPVFDTRTGDFAWGPVDTDGGTYTATFSVSDGRLTATAAPITITVTANNRPPVANAGGNYTGQTGQPVALDGSASSDPDAGQTLTYHWEFGDGHSANGAIVDHAYLVAGTFIATLTVADDGTPQLSASDFASLVIRNEVPAQLLLRNGASTVRTHGGGREKIGIEETEYPLTSILAGSLTMSTTYPNAGSVKSIPVQTKGATIGDMDLDGVADLDLYVLRPDLDALLSKVPNNTSVTLQVTGEIQLVVGTAPFRASKVVKVKSSGNAAALAAHPNPFYPRTSIAYTTGVDGPVTMDVYSIDGRRVRALMQNEYTYAGPHEVAWNGFDDSGRRVPSGIYFVKASVAGETSVFKLSIVK